MNAFIKYSLITSILLTSVCNAIAAEPQTTPKHITKQTWYMAKSPNFTILSDTGKKRTVELAKNLERFRSAFSLLTNVTLSETMRPVTVIASKRDKTYKLLRGDSDVIKNSSGFFQDSLTGNFSAIKVSKQRNTFDLKILFHEYTHYAKANLVTNNSPFWYNEGFAEYMGQIEFKNDLVMNFGKPSPWHLHNINNTEWMPLEELLNATYIKSDEKERRYKIYSQGWLLTHYLSHNNKDRKVKWKLLSLLSEGVDPVDAIEQTTNNNFDDFENELRAYARKQKHSFQEIHLENPLDVNELSVVKLSKAEANYQIGEFILQARNNMDVARSFFEKAVEIDNQHVNAITGLANTYLGSDIEKMTRLIDQAKGIEPNNPWLATVSGHLNSWKMNIAEDEATRKEFWNKAARDYNVAINSSSLNVEAISAAASLYWNAKRYEKFLELTELTYLIAPSNYNIRTKLIAAYVTNNQLEKAEEIATLVRRNHHMSSEQLEKFEEWYKQIN